MKKLFRLFFQLLAINFKYFLEYRISLLLSFFLTFFWILSYIVFVEVIFYNINTLAGLNKGQVLLIFSFYYLFQTIGNIIYRDNFEEFADNMRRGELDFILTKPVPHRMMIFCHKMRFDFLSSFVIVVFLMIYSYQNLDQPFEIIPFAIGCFYSIVGTIIFYCLLSMISSLAFWLNRNETLGVLIWNLSQISRYPRQIFNKMFAFILTFILPFALLASIPAEISLRLVEKEYLVYTIIVTVVIYSLSLLLWKLGIKRYSSAS